MSTSTAKHPRGNNIQKRSEGDIRRIQQVLMDVAGAAIPPLDPTLLITGNPRADKCHIGRLRMIACSRLYDIGIRPGEISKLFRLTPSASLSAIRGLPRLRENGRYSHYFNPLPIP